MRMHKATQSDGEIGPESRSELHRWVRERLSLSPDNEQALLDAIDSVFMHHERLWQQSKQEAIQAVSAGFAERLNRMRQELTARDATASSIARYFEELVADLTDRVHRDPKTRLMNFRRFIEQLEAFLALEQRGQWCAIGHALGDKIIDRVARLLREQIRSDDLIAKESVDVRVSQDMHARFGGDEFCFLIPDLVQFDAAEVIAERFREAVERCDWSAVDPRLAEKPVNVDVGVVCLLLGSVHERRPYAHQLANDLLTRADQLMYESKAHSSRRVSSTSVRVVDGTLQNIDPEELSA
jgi:GGDEF domain-containing protein